MFHRKRAITCCFAFLLCSVLGAIPHAALAQRQVLVAYSTGTGFFVSGDGYLVTNSHVVEDCTKITISGPVSETPAVLVARDAEHDLALLKSQIRSFHYARFNSMKQPLRERDPVIIIGYPGEAWKTGRTITRRAEIIDIKALREDGRWMAFTDAVAQGNSGGPLLDASANVVGVVSAKGQSYTYDLRSGYREDVQKIGLAISLPVMRKFLRDNGMRYGQSDSGLFLSTRAIEDKAKDFIINVRCRHRDGSPRSPKTRQIRLKFQP